MNDKLTRVKGFEEIKNPSYLAEYDLIDNYVSSGVDYTNFFKLIGDSVRSFNRTVYDYHGREGHPDFDSVYASVLDSILLTDLTFTVDINEALWNNLILPFIERDVLKLDDIVHFPLKGDWGYLMNLDVKENNWTKDLFFKTLNLYLHLKLSQVLKLKD